MAKNYKKGASGEDKVKKKSSGSSMFDQLVAAGMEPSKGIEKPEPKKSKPSNDCTKGNKNESKNTGSKNVSKQKFINPYTFVPISDKEPQRIKFEDLDLDISDKLDGCIECTLETKSSVFVPNTTRTFEYGFNEFFSYDDLSGRNKKDIPKENPKYPRIPGSEIRGMIRNIYEQLTDSCLSVIDDKNLAVKRSAKPKEAGIWDRENDILYKAKRKKISFYKLKELGYEKGKNYITGSEIYITCNEDDYVIDVDFKFLKGATKGIVIKGEKFTNKKNESVLIFPEKEDIVKDKLTQQDKDRFQAVLDRYDKKTKDGNEYDDYKNAYYNSDIRYLPVFYEKVEDKLYLAPAMMTKEVFENTISEILEHNHFKHHACNSNTGFCPACRLFGTIADKKSLASRLRFTDTEVFENAEFDVPRLIPVLGTPKYSSTEFYLKKPKDSQAAMWNYDYYTVNKEGDKGIKKLATYKAKLKGRKVYWQGSDKLKNERSLDAQKLFEKDNQSKTGENNIKIRSAGRALMPGAKTRFKVYFEDISEEELAALLYSLTLGNDCNHRIGRGKPYGMGAVKVNVEKLNLRNYSFDEGKLSITENEADPENYKMKNLWEENKRYIELYSVPLAEGEEELVGYPTPADGKEIFKWFANNRGNVQAPKIDQCLPDIKDKDKCLLKNSKNKGKDLI
ncbi:TIGR03986 family type III CRISPR-associated RAMP protein [Lachnoanaerobaculum sp. OBRC5-5]|uniref:TIGR03986 family type III CRISPR-associated RAMP protein n=1 Tax=Lachnoanaerobaculum sp. OBRC5-5 TaxID=936595 RepID=UPI000282511D|nr:TIGR03986 family CRISPR-associated RAMP protein [Lachnoanaerobaculum sp. OBRC5-5]EJZ68970.1 CRISPR-associated protein [Lachnoanaerobaculum sp. OBRC5-5]